MSQYLTNETFKKNLNTQFWLVDANLQPYALELVECTDGHSTRGMSNFAFSFAEMQVRCFRSGFIR